MRLTWMGTAGLLFTAGDTTIAFDPFPGIPYVPYSKRPCTIPDEPVYRRASDVFVTHGHFDHILFLPELYRDTDTVIHATATPCRTLARHGLPETQLHRIGPGWSGSVGPFRLRAWQGRHCRFDAPLVRRTVLQKHFRAHAMHLLSMNLQYPEHGEILFYELTDGTARVQIMGSMNLDGETDYPTGADWLILPYQGKSRPEACALSLVERLRPKQVLLDHYDDSFPPITSLIPTDGITELLAQRGISCHPLQKYDTMTLSSADKEKHALRMVSTEKGCDLI